MRQMVFAYVSVQGWIVDPYVYGFSYQPHEVVILPPHYTEIVHCSGMTCGVAIRHWVKFENISIKDR